MAQADSQRKSDHSPPNPPWIAIDTVNPEIGYLAFFLSDELARLPVRGVTLPGNNKSDPNLETATFGLFSTCEQLMRSSVVKRGVSYLFFITRWAGQRALCGYYQLGWFAQGVFGSDKSDFALAAKRTRFVEPAAISELPQVVRDTASTAWRTFKLLDAKQTEALRDLIDSADDRTDEYLEEIERLERFNLQYTGHRCWQRTEPFTWIAAGEYLNATPSAATTSKVLNSSPTGHWRCESCEVIVQNKALLKSCPGCGELGTLRPATADEVPATR